MLIKYFWILFSVIKQLIIKIKCECEDCSENNCKLVFNGETETCILCSNDVTDNDYYEYTEGLCQKVATIESSKFLIENTKQIVGDCNDVYKYKMGSICYKNQPKNSKKGEDDQYKCLYNYTKETIDGFVYLNCLDLYEKCPSDYNYFSFTDKNYYQCVKKSDDCDNEFIYEEKKGDDSNYYCLSECPSKSKYHYIEEENNKKKCVEKCNFETNGDYFISNNLECTKKDEDISCSGYINIDKERNIFECITTTFEKCSENYPYLYVNESKNYCLKSCTYTESIPFFRTKTYIFESTDTDTNMKYQCLDNPPSSKEPEVKYYKDNSALKWVLDCKTSISGPYHNESDFTCYNSCDQYYNDLECVTNCGSLYKDDSTKICYIKCPSNLGKGFYNNDDNKECQSCNSTQGFYTANDQRCYSGEVFCNINNKNYYYNYDDNYCFEKECKDYSKYKYHANEKFKCHKTCSDLNSDSETYKFEKDYTCYIEDPGISEDYKYKYKLSSEFTKYITENQLSECLELNLKYLKNSECVSECGTSDYIVLPQQSKMGKCLLTNEELNEINGCKYYNKSKICSNQCNFYKILDETGNLEVIDNENCVEKCPDNYYENAYDKTCLNKCGNELYNDESTHKCVSKCNPGFYEVNSDGKKCVDKCKTESEQFAYYMDTGECKTECPDTHPYSYNAIKDHQLCLKSCPKYYKDKTCMDECEYYKNGNCSDDCSDFTYIHPGNVCSNEECPKSAPFFYSQSSSSYKICNTSCPENYYKNYKSEGSTSSNNNNIECISSCEGVTFNDGCYDACPNGLYNSSGECIANCPKNFYKSENGYTCIEDCNSITDYIYLTSSGECVKDCALGENYIGINDKCLKKCENDGYFEILKKTTYNIYKCVTDCENTSGNNYHVNGTKECISSCGKLYEYENVCYQNCLGIEGHSYSLNQTTNDEDKYTCKESCGDNKYYGNNHICIDSCNELPFNKTANHDNSCVSECDLQSNYKFLVKESDDRLFCKDKCSNNKRYLTSNYVCIDVCPSPYIFVVINESNPAECLTKCPDEKPYANKISNDNEEYICSETKCSNYYYPNNYTCTEKCNEGDYVLETNDLKICSTYCDYYNSTKLYYYEKGTDKKCVFNCKDTDYKYTSIDGNCAESCKENEFYDENDFVCKFRCPTGKKIDGQICREKCNDETKNLTKFENENGYCVDNCSESKTTYIYNNENEFKCLKNCSDLYIDNNVCKASCSTKFILGKNCVDECQIPKKYFTNENNIKVCLSDCPANKSFYTEEEGDNKYMCTDVCNAYIPNLDPKINAKKCLGDCKGDYPYYILEDETNASSRKICYKSCPSSYPYYSEEKDTGSMNLRCFKECPENEVHLPDKYKCDAISDCKSKIINYKEKECVERCSITDSFYVKEEIKYCVDNCTYAQNYILKQSNSLYLTYNKECVSSCSDNSSIVGDLCVCKRLFYLDKKTGDKTCLKEDLTLCESISDYPIINIDTNECRDYCDGILSLSGFECYNNTYKCNQNETIKTFTNGNKQCDCIDKYYYTDDERKKKKCLGENEECPSSHSMYIKDTKECVEECSTTGLYTKQYGKICVSSCPSSTTENDGKCECSGKWYVTDRYEVICLDGNCPINKELLIKETKQCVSTCIGTGYEVYYNKTCINNCDGKNDREEVDSVGNIYVEKISKKYCKCKGPWYYDINGNEICESEAQECNQLEGTNLKFTINPTNQCVNICPPEYKYSFGYLCFKSCEFASTSLNKDLLTDDNSKTCKCRNYWKVENNEIICLVSSENYKLINDTKECIDIEENCPKEYPLLFNNICYKSGKCPEEKNVYYDVVTQKCICVGKWYNNLGEVICLDDCPITYPYLIYSTKECKQNKDTLLFEFNNVFYNNCPQNTLADENSGNKVCICNPLLGYYYFTITSGNKIYHCAQEKCPIDHPLYEYQKKECITDCTEGYPYRYQGICYQKCPNLTEVVENTNECQIKSIDTEITLENLEKQMSENIVELYSKSNAYNSQNARQKIVTTNATVEFYGVNKNNKDNENKNIKSDLSYIDISSCLDKIYKINNMDKNDDIVILKYDLNMIQEKLLINPVEYKFINSRTGQALDATVCEHNSIKISYPVHDLISKYDKLMKQLRKLEYIKIDLTSNNRDSLREKLDKGKEITQDYSDTDIFNINDRIYSDICIAVEVDGKDLTLEERINYFYPQLALCENNCTYNHTDFINERIYCDCSYKIEFDFDREYSTPFELNLNEVNNKQSGNSNIAVMKCISNLKYTKSFKNNGGFIYTLIILMAEVGLLLIIIFYGITSLASRLKNKMVESDDDFDQKKITVVTSPRKRTYEDVKTTQRILDNPPKKKVADFDMEFIPQEYLFLFFNKGEKNSHKKLERNNLPFKIGMNTKLLLEQIKGVNYNNIKPTGPFPAGQNLIFIIDSMDENIEDYLKLDNVDEKGERNDENNNNPKDDDEMSEKKSEKPSIYKNKKNQVTNSDYDPSDENYSDFDIYENDGKIHEKTFIEALKRNQRLIKKDYAIALENKSTNFFETLLTEIIDKLYIIKIIFFTRKFDILTLQLSVYLLCHTLLLVLNALFFDVKTIKKIWNEENYPGLGYYLGFGFLSCIIVWIIYKIFLCLLSNNDKTKEVLKMIHYNNKYNLGKLGPINKKYNNLMWKIKFKIAIYSIVEFLLLIFCFLYLCTFCSVYTGTQSKVFKAYGIALIEVLIIKIIYGIALAIMRYISLSYSKKGLYDVVLFMNTYLV